MPAMRFTDGILIKQIRSTFAVFDTLWEVGSLRKPGLGYQMLNRWVSSDKGSFSPVAQDENDVV